MRRPRASSSALSSTSTRPTSKPRARAPVHTARKILVVPVKDILWFAVESRLVYAPVDGEGVNPARTPSSGTGRGFNVLDAK